MYQNGSRNRLSVFAPERFWSGTHVFCFLCFAVVRMVGSKESH